MTIFSGKCDGGPYHGKPLHHGAPAFQVALWGDKPVTYRAPQAEANKAVRSGEYHHANGRWVWKET